MMIAFQVAILSVFLLTTAVVESFTTTPLSFSSSSPLPLSSSLSNPTTTKVWMVSSSNAADGIISVDSSSATSTKKKTNNAFDGEDLMTCPRGYYLNSVKEQCTPLGPLGKVSQSIEFYAPYIKHMSRKISNLFGFDTNKLSSLGIGFALSYAILSTINGAISLSLAWYISCRRVSKTPFDKMRKGDCKIGLSCVRIFVSFEKMKQTNPYLFSIISFSLFIFSYHLYYSPIIIITHSLSSSISIYRLDYHH